MLDDEAPPFIDGDHAVSFRKQTPMGVWVTSTVLISFIVVFSLCRFARLAICRGQIQSRAYRFDERREAFRLAIFGNHDLHGDDWKPHRARFLTRELIDGLLGHCSVT
jgi:hypothetical protein